MGLLIWKRFNRFWAILALVFIATISLLPTAPLAQESAIEEVIANQLSAFEDRDIARAFDYASPMIRGMFGDAGNFGMMVQQGYPMVWDHDEVRFKELREIAGSLYQKVMIRDAAGQLHVLDYKMIETPYGWRIDGVSILPAPDVGV